MPTFSHSTGWIRLPRRAVQIRWTPQRRVFSADGLDDLHSTAYTLRLIQTNPDYVPERNYRVSYHQPNFWIGVLGILVTIYFGFLTKNAFKH